METFLTKSNIEKIVLNLSEQNLSDNERDAIIAECVLDLVGISYINSVTDGEINYQENQLNFIDYWVEKFNLSKKLI
jgi:hypothetical protein